MVIPAVIVRELRQSIGFRFQGNTQSLCILYLNVRYMGIFKKGGSAYR